MQAIRTARGRRQSLRDREGALRDELLQGRARSLPPQWIPASSLKLALASGSIHACFCAILRYPALCDTALHFARTRSCLSGVRTRRCSPETTSIPMMSNKSTFSTRVFKCQFFQTQPLHKAMCCACTCNTAPLQNARARTRSRNPHRRSLLQNRWSSILMVGFRKTFGTQALYHAVCLLQLQRHVVKFSLVVLPWRVSKVSHHRPSFPQHNNKRHSNHSERHETENQRHKKKETRTHTIHITHAQR